MKYLLLLGLFGSFAWANHFTGTYTVNTGEGTVTLVLLHGGDGTLAGELRGAGETLSLEGFANSEGGLGTITTPDAVMGFEAYLRDDDTVLGFYLFEYTPAGEANQDTVQEVVFERRSYEADLGTAPAATPAAPPNTDASNPLSPSPPANDPLVGRFSDGAVVLTLRAEGGGYAGQLEFNGQAFPVRAQGSAAALQGDFESGGNRFVFEAVLQGATLRFTTGGSSYALSRQQDASNPLAGGSNIRPPDPTSPIIARGQYAELSQDNALAFIEALEFSLAQVGFTYAFTDADRQQAFQAMVQEYPFADREDQQVLAQARDIWNRVQSNWASATLQDRQVFILGVLTLAFGEETVVENLGQGSSTLGPGEGASCDQIEECMSMFAPEAYQDMMMAEGCWASAGCTDYDSTTGTYTYEEYNPTYDTYDTYDTN